MPPTNIVCAPRPTNRRVIVAVDGGAATGKSTLCAAIAREFRVPYFNAGLLYRALVLACLEHHADLDSESECAQTWEAADVDVEFTDLRTTIRLDGIDVTNRLKDAEVTRSVARASRHPAVRKLVTARQREILRSDAAARGIIIDGRDVTSRVVPEAQVKILLLATDTAIATRSGERSGNERDDLARNAADAQVSDFQTAGPGVVAIDTDELSPEEVRYMVIETVRQAIEGHG